MTISTGTEKTFNKVQHPSGNKWEETKNQRNAPQYNKIYEQQAYTQYEYISYKIWEEKGNFSPLLSNTVCDLS